MERRVQFARWGNAGAIRNAESALRARRLADLELDLAVRRIERRIARVEAAKEAALPDDPRRNSR